MQQRVDYANLIIKPQGFGRLRPVSSLLKITSQSQAKKWQLSIYKRFIMLSNESDDVL